MDPVVPTPVNLTCRRYNAFCQSLTALDANGYAVPLFGCTARLQVRTAAGAADPPLLDLSTDDLTDAGSGLAIDADGNLAITVQGVDISAAVAAFAPGVVATLQWDVLVDFPEGLSPLTTHYGAWTVTPTVTTAQAAPGAPGMLDLGNPYAAILPLSLGVA